MRENSTVVRRGRRARRRESGGAVARVGCDGADETDWAFGAREM